MLKRYMHKRERYFAMLNDDRVVRPFEWGLEFIGEDPDATDPHAVLAKFSAETIANSDEYFSIPESFEFSLRRDAHESVPPAVAGGSTRGKNPPATAGGTDSIQHVLTWPSAVATPSREELNGRGTIARLVERGRDNLRALLDSGAVRAHTVGQEGRGAFTAVRGESLFTASLALLLPETMARLTGDEDWGRGALVAVPSRHELLYRPIDASDARIALGDMHHVTLLGLDGEVGRLSPDVFWVRRQSWVQLTSSVGGKPRILRGTGFREALAGL